MARTVALVAVLVAFAEQTVAQTGAKFRAGDSSLPTAGDYAARRAAWARENTSPTVPHARVAQHSPLAAPPGESPAAPARAPQSAAPNEKNSSAIALSPRSTARKAESPSQETRGPSQAVLSTAASLAMVLGAFLLLVWFTRKNQKGAGGQLPTDVFEVIGRAALAPKLNVHLVRFGDRVLLVSAGPEGVSTLAEVEDADEAQRLKAACLAGKPGSVSATFREVLGELGKRGRTAADTANSTAPRGRERRNG